MILITSDLKELHIHYSLLKVKGETLPETLVYHFTYSRCIVKKVNKRELTFLIAGIDQNL